METSPSEVGAQPNFNDTVTNAVNAANDVTGDHPIYPGGVTAPGDSTPVLTVSFNDEMGKYTFNDALTNVKVDDAASGAASVTLNITGEEDGKKCGYVSARIIGDHASRVYVFREDDEATDTTTFIAKFTYNPA